MSRLEHFSSNPGEAGLANVLSSGLLSGDYCARTPCLRGRLAGRFRLARPRSRQWSTAATVTGSVVAVYGVRVLFGDGWGLVRASNTQRLIVVRYEAKTARRLAGIRGVMEGWLRAEGGI